MKNLSNYFVKRLIILFIFWVINPIECFSQDQDAQKNENNKEEEINKAEDKNNNNPLTKIGEALLKKRDILPSIMFSDEDIKKVNNSLNSNFEEDLPEGSEEEEEEEEVKEKPKEREISSIHLGSILYINKSNWLVWLNNKKLSAATNARQNEFYIKKINKNYVNILWTLSLSKWKILSGKQHESLAPYVNESNQVEIDFILQPNQTYNLISDQIIEGKVKSNAE